MTKAFPYTALTVKKYRSPHAQDLSFAKGETIQVTGVAPKTAPQDDDDDDDDDDEWLVGTSADGSRSGTFPASHVVEADEPAATTKAQATSDSVTPAADLVPAAAVEAARQGKTEEKAALGAPLPPRPASPDDDDEPTQVEEEETKADEAVQVQTPIVQVKSDATPVAAAEAAAPVAAPAAPAASTPAAATTPVASPAEAPAPAKSPPPPAPKPGGLAARIAAFNKAPEAAPPLLPRKPGSLGAAAGGWKRPPPAPGAPKPVLPGSAVPPARSTPAAAAPLAAADQSAPTTDATSSAHAAFSAADAQASIKMSLKERMAALQRGSAAADAGEAARSPPPVANKPGRLAADRKNVALAGLTAAVESPAKSPIGGEGEEEASVKPDVAQQSLLPSSDVQTIGADAEATEAVSPNDAQEDAQPDAEQTEEEQEAQRRAAIAKRMAALGGRRMGAPMFGAPAPAAAPVPASTGDADSAVSPSTESLDDDAAAAPAAEATPDDAAVEEAPKTLAVPRRAAPPRRKRSAAKETTAEAAAATATLSATSGDDEAPIEAAESATSPVEETGKQPHALQTSVQDITTSHSPDAVTPITPLSATGSTALLGTDLAATLDQRRGSADTTATSQSQIELRESAKALEEFVLSQQGDDADALEEEARRAVSAVEAGDQIPADEPEDDAEQQVPGEENAAPQTPARPPSARPPSTRPPIPKSSLPPADAEAAVPSSPASQPALPFRPPSRQLPTPTLGEKRLSMAGSPPPMPRSPPPLPKTPVPEEDTPSLGAVAASIAEPPKLAAPQPRHAVVAEHSDDEEEDVEPPTVTAATPTAAPPAAAAAAAPQEAAAATVDEPEAEVELTEEEQEAQRRAAIARRMASLGGQRMGGLPGMPPGMPPIMGAPMPPRRKATSSSVSEDPQPEPAAPERLASPPPVPNAAASPPPRPTSAAPALPRSTPSSGAGVEPTRRSSVVSITSENAEGSVTRRMSMRPPVPVGVHSRESSAQVLEDDAELEQEIEEAASQDAPFTAAPPALPTSPPPALPTSPPPNLPTSPPPAPPARSAPEPVEPTSSAALEQGIKPTERLPSTQAGVAAHERVSSSAIRPSSRDLDLSFQTRWWRQSPLRLPIARPDASIFVQKHPDQGTRHDFTARVVFDDYSSTTIECNFEDNDSEENNTSLEQRHSFPPPKPDAATLQKWSQDVGSIVAHQAAGSISGKSSAVVGDGSSRAFAAALLAAIASALPPVGSSWGYPILAQAGATILDRAADPTIRPGDIVTLHGAQLSGKRGLGSYNATYGTPGDPAVGIVLELDEKKPKKCRCAMQQSSKRKGPEEVTLRLDDVKQGIVKVFRIAPHGWVEV